MIRVLCVEDNPYDRALIRDVLERESEGFVVIEASDRAAFEKALVEGEFDAVLTDLNILGFEGLEVLQKVRERYSDIPVILVTGTGSEEIAVKALKQGADDYVIKTPHHISQLPHTILSALDHLKARKKLLQSEKNLQNVMENTSDGILVVDQEGIVLYANPAGQEMLGNPPERLAGRFFGYPITCDASVDIDLPLRLGGHGTAEMRTTEIVWNNKNCYLIVLRDITARRSAEKKLIEAKNHLVHLFTVIPSIVYTINPETFIPTWISPNITRILGYTIEEALKPGWWTDNLHPEDRKKALNARAEIHTKEFICHEYRFRKKEGKYVWIRDEFQVAHDVLGKFPEIVGAWSDVTHERQMEEEQEKLQAQLIHAQKMESIGRLAGGVAHDFNNMLSIIIGYGENILEQLHHNDPLREDVMTIIDAGKRSAALTRQLLAFSRKQTLQPEILNINDVVRNIEKMLYRLIEEDIDLEFLLSEDLFQVKVDPGQIEQVLMNLAVNARDAMPEGGKLIIETSNVELDEAYAKKHFGVVPGKYVMLAVTDTGCGMDKKTMQKIFEPFFTTKEKEKGTGLGLSTVYGIVRQSGGYIWVYSEPGQGTTFKVYLPRTEEKQNPKTNADGKEITPVDGKHILVVEDEKSLRKMMGRMLSGLNYKVTLASNGGEALLLVEEKGLKPDLVITDVIMPLMNGKDLVNRLQKKEPDLKVLYMSGYTDNAIIHKGILDPGTHFIQKPFTLNNLVDKIQEVLREG